MLCFLTPPLTELEALDEEAESENDLMVYLVDAIGYILKSNRAGVFESVCACERV